MVPDGARWCQVLPAQMLPVAGKSFQMPQMIPDAARCCQPRCCQMLPDAPKCCQILPDAPGCHHMMPDPARCSQMPSDRNNTTPSFTHLYVRKECWFGFAREDTSFYPYNGRKSARRNFVGAALIDPPSRAESPITRASRLSSHSTFWGFLSRATAGGKP